MNFDFLHELRENQFYLSYLAEKKVFKNFIVFVFKFRLILSLNFKDTM